VINLIEAYWHFYTPKKNLRLILSFDYCIHTILAQSDHIKQRCVTVYIILGSRNNILEKFFLYTLISSNHFLFSNNFQLGYLIKVKPIADAHQSNPNFIFSGTEKSFPFDSLSILIWNKVWKFDLLLDGSRVRTWHVRK